MSPEKLSIITASYGHYPAGYIRVIDLLIKNNQNAFFSLRIQSQADRMREEHKAAVHNRILPERNVWYTKTEPITKEIIHRILLTRNVRDYLEPLDVQSASSNTPASDYQSNDQIIGRDVDA